MESTTDLDEIIFGVRSNFTWGEAVSIHSIGEYDVVEYHPHEYKNNSATGRINYGQKEYSCYLNKKHLGRSAESLDAALAHCIASKHDGVNTYAGMYFMRMIG